MTRSLSPGIPGAVIATAYSGLIASRVLQCENPEIDPGSTAAVDHGAKHTRFADNTGFDNPATKHGVTQMGATGDGITDEMVDCTGEHLLGKTAHIRGNAQGNDPLDQVARLKALIANGTLYATADGLCDGAKGVEFAHASGHVLPKTARRTLATSQPARGAAKMGRTGTIAEQPDALFA